MTNRVVGISLVLAAILLASTSSVNSKRNDDIKNYIGQCSKSTNPDTLIRSCSLAIVLVSRSGSGAQELAGMYYNRGLGYRKKGENDLAILDYSRAIDLKPGFAMAFNNRGNCYDDKGEHERAILDYDRAIELDPKRAMTFYNRGIAHHNMCDYTRAIRDYDDALRLEPNLALALQNRDMASHKRGGNPALCQLIQEDV